MACHRASAGLVGRHDAWVLEPRPDQRLAQKPQLVDRASRDELLDRDVAAEATIVGARYAAETAAAVLAENLVSPGPELISGTLGWLSGDAVAVVVRVGSLRRGPVAIVGEACLSSEPTVVATIADF